MNKHSYIIVIGGGLAGLTSAIDLAQKGIQVTVIEKETYPKHKVCGEYISNEVLPYLEHLNLNIDQLQPVKIENFQISTSNGKRIHSHLPLGGFGVSRFALDNYLWNEAGKLGVKLITDQVTDVFFEDETFTITTSEHGKLTSDFVIGAYGKRSGLDRSLKRGFSNKKSPWLAVKAHYKADFQEDLVSLHNFKGGYCGLSKVENGNVNACYLVSYESFKQYKKIEDFQEHVMYENPNLANFFQNAEITFDKPIAISQINFEYKKPVVNHIFMCGDAAGLIHPLCGNGMAMAIQSAQMISCLISKYYHGMERTREELELMYAKRWKKQFGTRLRTGRILQKVLLNPNLQSIAYGFVKICPWIVPIIINKTHGKPLVCS